MTGSIRKWCISLLVAMLPLQGMAAATMALCDPAHHARAAAVATAHDSAAAQRAHGHARDNAHHAQGHTHDSVQSHAIEQPSDGGDATPLASAGDAHTCSACASCCGAAAPSALTGFESAPPGPATFAALASKVEPFATGADERPPRRLFA